MILALPSAKCVWSAESAAQKLQALEGTPLFKLSSRSAQEKVRIAQNMVAAISEGRKPDVRAMGEDDFVATVVSACQWFVEHQAKPTDPILYGKAALAKKLENLENKKKGKTAVTYIELQPLCVFSWLLTEQENAIIVEMVKNCTDKKELAPVAAAAASSSSSSSSKLDEKKAFESSAMKKALDMFN